jgi:hypothetical protein
MLSSNMTSKTGFPYHSGAERVLVDLRSSVVDDSAVEVEVQVKEALDGDNRSHDILLRDEVVIICPNAMVQPINDSLAHPKSPAKIVSE